jgi:hypothetical protein
MMTDPAVDKREDFRMLFSPFSFPHEYVAKTREFHQVSVR